MTTNDQPERPGMEHYSDTPMFNTKAVVQQTGVPAPTLRAWERRYALIMPERAENTYRLYSERDIALVRWLKQRVDEGMSISQAVALFRHQAREQQSTQEHVKQYAEQEDVYFEVPAERPGAFQNAEATPTSDMEPIKQAHRGQSTSPPFSAGAFFQADYAGVYNMQSARESLLEAFQNLDEQSAHAMMEVMLSLYPIEQVCLELITPTMWEIGSMWAEAEITVSIEHFASNFFRAFLFNLFHVTPNYLQGPLVLTCCAPGESHELPALMLSLFLRRRGMRVVYLGQSIETTSLIHTVKKLAPALVCVSVTILAYIPALAYLARQIETLPAPRPLFAFGGQAFARFPHAASSVPGIHLEDDDLRIVIQRLLVLLADNSNPHYG